MIEIPGYHVEKSIYESPRSAIYKGWKLADNKPVIFKTLKNRYPGNEEIARLLYEYDLLQRLDFPEAPVLIGLELYSNIPVIVMEDFGGESLEKLIDIKTFTIEESLEIAIEITRQLEGIHNAHIIHKDIVPSNILYNTISRQLMIIDFGISTRFSREDLTVSILSHLEGTLSYISPEQTGRMNRPLDYRTDFYSLGMTCYKLFSGTLPFTGEDPLEIIHCHIASIPKPLHELNPRIPRVLSDIVMKLISKASEDRYQSTFGIINDLSLCLDYLKRGTSISFGIGKEDIPGKFRVSEKLYGREEEIDYLIEIFEKVGNGKKEMILCKGFPGIGKSVLINEIHRPVIENRAYFCRGKYDQYSKTIPYKGLIDAFRELAAQVLSETEDRLETMKREILKAVGSNGQVIIDIIKEVEFIIGKQPQVQKLPPIEAQNRFNLVFQNFLKVFARKDHPLVVFLDDLQWVDSASLDLIHTLLDDHDLTFFLFIGAFRDNEINHEHPFSLMLDKLKKSGFRWHTIPLGPLDEYQVTHMVSDTFYCNTDKCRDLARLLLQKTGGNPFFLKEYLKTLYDNRLIEFVYSEGVPHWTWDINKIRLAGITDNVVELMAQKIKKLSQNTLNALKIACCMGIKVSLPLLAAVNKATVPNTVDVLQEAIDEGILISFENSLKFVHDRVWDACYSLLDEKERIGLHYSIGKYMIEEGKKANIDEFIFVIAEQWNHAKDLLNEEERRILLEIDYKAGHKSRISSAYNAATEFFRHGGGFLSLDSWKTDYKFTLAYYTEWSQAEYLARNMKEAEALFDLILDKAVDMMEKVKINSIQIDHYIAQTQFKKALDVGVKTLNELGISISKNPGKIPVLYELLKAKILSGKRKISDLENQEEMKNEKIQAAMDIMEKCIPASIIVAPNFVPIFSMKMVNLTFKYGISPKSAFGYVMYGVILSGILGDITNGYEFGKLSVKIAERYNFEIIQSRIYFIFGYMIMHLKRHFMDIENYFMKVRECGSATGDFLYLAYAYFNFGYILLFSGENLDSIKINFFQKYQNSMLRLNQPHTTDYFNLWYQAILNLSGESEDRLILKGEAFNEIDMIPRFQETKDEAGIAQYYLIKQVLYFFAGDYEAGLDYSRKIEKLMPNLLGMSIIQISYFFYGLILAALCSTTDKVKSNHYIGKLVSIRKKYKKWGQYNKHNYLNKYLLLSAEISRLKGKELGETIKLYSESIKVAHRSHLIHEEAMACELMARFLLSKDQEKIASLYMSEAHYCYKRWGGNARAKFLETTYPHLVDVKRVRYRMNSADEITVSENDASNRFLDLDTILKASNTISSEIKLDELLKKMMHIAIENAGAQKGYFLLSQSGNWFIEAEGSIDHEDSKILQSIPLYYGKDEHSLPRLSITIMKYVERTKETVVLHDALHKGSFTQDDYIKTQRPKSVLCMPFLNQGQLAGILYMENNLTTGVFTQERLGVLSTLSSQMAISIENARMYKYLDELNKNLEQKVFERTHELREKNEMILDSIRYSKRIQNAIMPLEGRLKDAFPQHFILFLPRDIVSGDFHWYTEIDHKHYLAVGDCTGHGVPGALLAMMGNIFLNEIIITRRILSPARILEELHRKVRTHLKQDEKEAETMDGMDVCLCSIEKESGKLVFAGARRPLYVVITEKINGKESKSRLIEIRGDRKSIGGRQKESNRIYSNHEFDIRKGDMVYLTSDGFIDQPDPDIKKYGSKRLKAFLTMIASFSSDQQKRYIVEELGIYRDSEKQRDDITIFGVRI